MEANSFVEIARVCCLCYTSILSLIYQQELKLRAYAKKVKISDSSNEYILSVRLKIVLSPNNSLNACTRTYFDF